MKKSILALCILATGCSAGSELQYDKNAYKNSDLTFIGVPTVFGIGIQGTTFPVSKHYSLTAKHVAKYSLNKVVAYNNNCDLALIYKENNKINYPVFSYAHKDENVVNYGYSFLLDLPVSSKGTTENNTWLTNEYNKKCLVYKSTAGVRAGMSGGPVYNNENKVIGVNIAYDSKKNISYFIPVQQFYDWLSKNIPDEKMNLS